MIQTIKSIDPVAPRPSRISRLSGKIKNAGAKVKTFAANAKDTVSFSKISGKVAEVKERGIIRSIFDFGDRHETLGMIGSLTAMCAICSIPFAGMGVGAFLAATAATSLVGAGTIATPIAAIAGGGAGAVSGFFGAWALRDEIRFRS